MDGAGNTAEAPVVVACDAEAKTADKAGASAGGLTVTVLLFASARDAVGASETTVELPAGSTVADLRVALSAAFPKLASVLPTAHIAVDQEYAEPGVVIPARAEVALIPPVSGG